MSGRIRVGAPIERAVIDAAAPTGAAVGAVGAAAAALIGGAVVLSRRGFLFRAAIAVRNAARRVSSQRCGGSH